MGCKIFQEHIYQFRECGISFEATQQKRLFFPDGTARSVEFQPKYLMHVYAVVVLACEHWAERGVETEAHESHWQSREEELDGPRQRGESRGSQAGEEEKNREGNNKLIGLMADDWKEERTSQFRNMQNVLHMGAPWDNVRWKMTQFHRIGLKKY